MDEALLIVLKVLLYLLVFLGCFGAIGSFFLLLWLNSHVMKLSAFVQERLNDGLVQLADLTVQTSKTSTDDVLKLDTENSQKIYDAQVLQIQMLNRLLTGLGYSPPSPEESGIQPSPREIR